MSLMCPQSGVRGPVRSSIRGESSLVASYLVMMNKSPPFQIKLSTFMLVYSISGCLLLFLGSAVDELRSEPWKEEKTGLAGRHHPPPPRLTAHSPGGGEYRFVNEGSGGAQTANFNRIIPVGILISHPGERSARCRQQPPADPDAEHGKPLGASPVGAVWR